MNTKQIRLVFFVFNFLAFGAFFIFSFPSISISREEGSFLGKITKNRVVVRSGYNKNFNPVAFLNKDDIVVICGKNFSWYKVILPTDAACYIHSKFVKNTGKYEGLIETNKLNVRGGAGIQFGIVGQLKKGEEVIIRKKEGEWYKILPPENSYGWIFEDNLKKAGKAQEFLEKRKKITDFEKKFIALEEECQETLSMSGSGQILHLKNILKKIDLLAEEYANYKNIITQLKNKEKDILEQIKTINLAKQSSQSKKQDMIKAEGKIGELGNFLSRKGTHRLTKNSKTIFYLESKKINLSAFSNYSVEIWGIVEGSQKTGMPLIKVERLTICD